MTASRHKSHRGEALTLLWHTSLPQETKVFIGPEQIARLGSIVLQINAGANVLLLKQPTLEAVLLENILASLSEKNLNCVVMEIPDGEAGKSSTCLMAIWERLQELRFTRRDTILAVGGGALTDIAGFAASTYLRGLNFIAVPTTLLAQVDAAIGGKTGINLPTGKNLAGSFYFARAIVVDTSVLATLPRRDFVSGLGEIIKYGMIENTVAAASEYTAGPRSLFSFLEECLDDRFDSEHPALPGIITSCIKMKLSVVAKDPQEKDLRRSLNLGHTLGHGLEVATDFALSHGEAVAVGLVFATQLSIKRNKIEADQLSRLLALLQRAGLPQKLPPAISMERLMKAVLQDKKRDGSSIKMVLPEKTIGTVDYQADVSASDFESHLAFVLGAEH